MFFNLQNHIIMRTTIFFLHIILAVLFFTQNIGHSQNMYLVSYKIKGENFGEGKARLICTTEKSLYTYSINSSKEEPSAVFAGMELPTVQSDSKKQLNNKRAYLRTFNESLLYTEDITDYRYTVSDDIKISWQLVDGANKKIGGYDCKKAKAEVRGRTYEVWYAPKLKVPSGPWKLYGLPGLILEAASTDDKYRFIFENLEVLPAQPLTFAFQKPVLDYKSYSAEVDKHYKELARQMQRETQNRLVAFLTGGVKLNVKNIEKNFEKTYTSTDN